jgi:hypothetical protein
MPPFDMMRMIPHKAPAYLVELLRTLAEQLTREKNKYDFFAGSVADYRICDMLRALSQENLQYINEIQSQLRILGADSNEDKLIYIAPELSPAFAATTDYSTEEILNLCRAGEKNMIAAFRTVLNEPFLPQDTRTLLRHQLNGVMYAFLQLKLVSSAFSY